MNLKCGGQKGRKHPRTWKEFKIMVAGNVCGSSTVAGVAVRVNPGWWKLKERRGIVWMEVALNKRR